MTTKEPSYPAPPLIVAIDGVAGSGKSTAARNLAKRLGVEYLDTGAMYRSVAFAALRWGIDPEDEEAVADLARTVNIDLRIDRVLVDGVDATIEIRGPEVSKAVSPVAANAAVRAELVARQRAWVRARGRGVVEGRDITTVVLPDAPVKVYMVADPTERAHRRHAQGTIGGLEAAAADLARRDMVDSTRKASPLTLSSDAVVIDTTHLTKAETLDRLLELVQECSGRVQDGKMLAPRSSCQGE